MAECKQEIFGFQVHGSRKVTGDFSGGYGARLFGESRLAVIDCGSNSFRLVVFTYTDTWWKRTDEIHEAVRVGEGLEGSGELQRSAMERALETLELYAHFCSATGIEQIRPVATSAIRDAANQAEFLGGRRSAPAWTSRSCPGPPRRATATWRRSTRRRCRTASSSTSAAARCSSRGSSTAWRSTRAPGRWAPCA